MDPKEPNAPGPDEEIVGASAAGFHSADDFAFISKEGPSRRRRRFLILVPAVFLALVAWTKVVSSDRYCASCHSMSAAAASSVRSIHSSVPCISCHGGAGAIGAITYVPTMLREGTAQLTGLGVAHRVLTSRSCSACHASLSAGAHPKGRTSDCSQCHGDVAHPSTTLPGSRLAATVAGHPTGFIQTHGQEAVAAPSTCVVCHQQRFCEACHLKETFPHPDLWISTHGKVEEKQGPTACLTCHGQTFCASCHGTEIPHRSDWLAQHPTALQGQTVGTCLTCHPQTDCTTCHSEHAVHTDQDLYTFPTRK